MMNTRILFLFVENSEGLDPRSRYGDCGTIARGRLVGLLVLTVVGGLGGCNPLEHYDQINATPCSTRTQAMPCSL